MKKIIVGLLGILTLSAMTACTPSPEKVCKHMFEIAEKEAEKNKSSKELSKEDREKAMKECVERAEKEKAKDGKKYECSAKCAMDLKSLDDMSSCTQKCGK